MKEMINKPLSFYAHYVDERINTSLLNKNTYIGVDNLLPNRGGVKVSDYLISDGTATKFRKNDILIGNIRPYFKKIWLATFDGGCSADVLCLRCKSNCNPTYLYSVLSQDLFFDYDMAGSKGSKMPRGDKNHIMSFPIPDMTIFEQKKVGEFIVSINKKIDINNHINDNLQQLLMESFVQQFECFASCNKQLKFDKVLKKNIPIDWNSIQIKSLASIESGYPFNSDNYSSVGQYKLITIKNVQDSGIDVDTGDRINIVPSDLPDYCKLKSKDILLSLTGNVGRVGLMFTDNCLLNQRVANITPLDESLRPYLFCLFKSQTLRITMERISGGTSQKNLSPIETGNLYIPFNYDIAKQFSIKTDPIISKYVECLKENLKLTQLRNELLPLLMNGQVSIT